MYPAHRVWKSHRKPLAWYEEPIVVEPEKNIIVFDSENREKTEGLPYG